MREVIHKSGDPIVKLLKGERHLRIIVQHDNKDHYPKLDSPKNLKETENQKYERIKDTERSQNDSI